MKLHEQLWLLELNESIEQNIKSSNFSTSQLAFLMNTSLSSLHRKLANLCNCTPAEYIRSKRLEVAKDMIDSGVEVTKVARKVGYSRIEPFISQYQELYPNG